MKPIVLFIEDDPEQVVLYKTKFEMEGFKVFFADNGTDGVAMAKEKKPGLIFLDVLLPHENGLDILKKLKKDELARGIPTVLFTNLSNKNTRDEGLRHGAVDFFVKTDITLKELVAWAKKNAKKA